MNAFRLMARNPWPWAIIAWFILFSSAMGAWVAVALRQNMDLVRADYYEEEIRYQKQIERIQRTARAGHEMDIAYDAARREVTLRLPGAHRAGQPHGRIHFYRPSNAALDFDCPLAPDMTGLQRVPADQLHPGFWRMQVQWTAWGEEYFSERSIVIEGGAGARTARPPVPIRFMASTHVQSLEVFPLHEPALRSRGRQSAHFPPEARSAPTDVGGYAGVNALRRWQ